MDLRRLKSTAVYALLLAWAFVCLFPIYWVAITSVKSIADIDQPPGFLPFYDFMPSLEAWRFILFAHNEKLVSRLTNSAVIGAAATILTVVVSGMAIYGLTRFPPAVRWPTLASTALAAGCASAIFFVSGFPLRAVLVVGAVVGVVMAFAMRKRGSVMSAYGATSFMLATRVLPPVVLVLPLYLMAIATGTRDTLSLMIIVYAAINVPVAVWLLLPVLGPRATDQEEAAQLDGASYLSVFFTILLPMFRASLASTALLVFLLCWNEYLFATYLTADNALTLPPWALG
jgi:multiple sugar transport system permease protein